MTYYIIVREANEQDKISSKDVLYSSIMCHCSSAFYLFLFQEITLQITVLLAALLFIFVGLPILWCVVTLPLVATIVYVFTYLAHVIKANEVLQIKPKKQWVAEAYEPYFLSASPKTLSYIILDEMEAEVSVVDADRMKKKIIGTVSVRDFQGPHDSLWLYGLAVDQRYRLKGAGSALVRAVTTWARSGGYASVELATTDLQQEARILFQKLGFTMTQMYHKQLIGAALTLSMFHMSMDFNIPNKRNY